MADKLIFRVHALRRMFEPGIAVDEVRAALDTGETIEQYLEDTPYPSRLVLGRRHAASARCSGGERGARGVDCHRRLQARPDVVGGGLPKEKNVKCAICKAGETRPGKTALTLERGSMVLVYRGVPAEMFTNCGEAYVGEEASARILIAAEEAGAAGVQVDVREFVATPA